jgi:hypothetical protein
MLVLNREHETDFLAGSVITGGVTLTGYDLFTPVIFPEFREQLIPST